MSKHCINCGKPDPGIHTCYDVFANSTGQIRDAAAARLQRIQSQAARIEALEAIVEKLRQGPDENEARIHQTGDYQTGLHCGVEDRCVVFDGYGAADYGFQEGVDAVLEWMNEIVSTRAIAQAAKKGART